MSILFSQEKCLDIYPYILTVFSSATHSSLCTFSQSLERPLENILHFFPVFRVYCLHDLNILCQIHRILSNQQTVLIIYLQQLHIVTIYIINGNWSKNIIQYTVACQL